MVAKNVKFSIIAMIVVGAVMTALFPVFLALMNQQPVASMNVKAQDVRLVVDKLITNNVKSKFVSGERLEMEFLVTPANKYFTVVVENGQPSVTDGEAEDPDVRFTVGSDVVSRLLSADDFFSEVKDLRDEGKIGMEMVKDYETLKSMGYQDIYDEITK
jgi:ribosomal protein L17